MIKQRMSKSNSKSKNPATGLRYQFAGSGMVRNPNNGINSEGLGFDINEPIDERIFEDNCPGYEPLPTVVPPVKRIIAIGDIHGDLDLALKCLRLGNLIDENHDWIGGQTVVVQVGDQIDRCRPNRQIDPDGTPEEPTKLFKCHEPETTKPDEASDITIMELFTKLHKQAVAVGGAVYSLLGNHELMNARGDLNYVSHAGIRQFDGYVDEDTGKVYPRGELGRYHAFQPGKKYAKFMGCTRQSAIIIGSCLFVHAGMVSEYVNKFNIEGPEQLAAINYQVRKWLLGHVTIENIKPIISSESYSPFWTRIFGKLPPNVDATDERCIRYLGKIFELYHVERMVVGHTPQFFSNDEGINKTCGDKIWRVDVGGSGAFSPFKNTDLHNHHTRAQVLEIIDDSIFNVLG